MRGRDFGTTGCIHPREGAVRKMGGIDDAPAAIVEEEDGDVDVFERSDAARQVTIGENKGVGHAALERGGNTSGQTVGVGVDFARHIVEIGACATGKLRPFVEFARRIDGDSALRKVFERIVIGLKIRTDAVFEHDIGEAQV